MNDPVSIKNSLCNPDKGILFSWTMENPSNVCVSQRVIPAFCFDIILPVSGYLIVDNHRIEKPFISPILWESKDIVFGENTVLKGLRIAPLHFQCITGINPCSLKQTFNYLDAFVPADRYNLLIEQLNTGDHSDAVYVALLHAFHNNQTRAIQTVKRHIVNEVIQKLTDDPDLKISSLAEELKISTRWITKVFKSTLNLSPRDVKKILKINRAIALLQEEIPMPLTDISYLSGYADQSHFIHAFKRFSQRTPSEFMRQKMAFYKIMNG